MPTYRELMQQALDALEHAQATEPIWKTPIREAKETLRARLAKPDPEQTRSEKMREAGYTKRDTRLECDECGKKFTRQMLPVHDCQPEPEQQLEWDEVFDYATAAYCRSSASKETLRLCFQHRNPQQEQVAIPWTANELMDFAKGIASIYNTPPVRQADSEPVAFICQGNAYMADDVDEYCRAKHTPLYTAPPQREWQGLTDEDMQGCIKTADYRQGQYKRTPYWAHLASAIEAKLREKNA